jgi:hypothetical protein
VPPCFELDRELDDPDFFPPLLEAPGELAILAARSLDMPLSFSASYCFSFLTFAFLFGMARSYPPRGCKNLRFGVDDDFCDARLRAADSLLDLARSRVRIGQRALRLHAQREERDQAHLGV